MGRNRVLREVGAKQAASGCERVAGKGLALAAQTDVDAENMLWIGVQFFAEMMNGEGHTLGESLELRVEGDVGGRTGIAGG